MREYDLAALQRLDASLTAALQQYKNDVVSAVRSRGDADGVQRLGNSGCFTVTVGKLLGGLNLAAETYSGPAQANAIQRKIAPCQTVTTTVAAIEEMIGRKKVKLPDGGSVTLNPNTIRVLEEFLVR